MYFSVLREFPGRPFYSVGRVGMNFGSGFQLSWVFRQPGFNFQLTRDFWSAL